MLTNQMGSKREGVILLVVLAMITLLTILGITFVLYSDSSEATARINLEVEKYSFQSAPIDWPASELMQIAFGQLIFDVEDNDAGQRSGMRGHSLARDMYGYRYSGVPFTGEIPANGSSMNLNDRPFRGTGRFAADKLKINYTTFFRNQNNLLIPDSIRDPERLGERLSLDTPNAYAGGFNPSYTFPDLNHVFLAKIGLDGQVDEPSFVRRIPIGTDSQVAPLGSFSNNAWDFSIPAWTESEGKYRLIRPRPAENPFFPNPADGWGDVRNLSWGTRNDAVWMDLGVEPKTAPSGKKYKPLFAFTVIDLDGRVNINVHGNAHGRNIWHGMWGIGAPTFHASGQGTGPWDVSLSRALHPNPGSFNKYWTPIDFQNFKIFYGENSIEGRHRGDRTLSGRFYPTASSVNPNIQHTHGPYDFNGSTDLPPHSGTFMGPLQLPGAPDYGTFGGGNLNNFFTPFGTFLEYFHGGGGFGELTTDGGPLNGSNAIHGSLFNPFSNFPGNKLFAHNNLGMLLGRSTKNPESYLGSELSKLGLFATSPHVPFNQRDDIYNRLTTLSWDMDRPGVFPSAISRSGSPGLLFPQRNWSPGVELQPGFDFPSSNSTMFPIQFERKGQGSLPNPPEDGDFDNLYQANPNLALAKRLSIRPHFTPFPQLNEQGLYSDQNVATVAMSERLFFTREVFRHLCIATNCLKPGDPGFPAGQKNHPAYQACKWIAQIAANITDNIDGDDSITIFDWGEGNQDSVAGTELSRIILNEMYVQVENDKSDIGKNRPEKDFRANIYLELHNPLLPNKTRLNQNPQDDHSAILKRGTQTIHALSLVKAGTIPQWVNNKNNAGFIGGIDPQLWINKTSEYVDYGSDLAIKAAVKPYPYLDDQTAGAGTFAPPGTGTENSFLVVGPKPDPSVSGIQDPENRWLNGPNQDIVYLSDLSFSIPKETKSLGETQVSDLPLILLRRLAFPGFPHQNDLNKPLYNPFVTIDMLQITPEMLKSNDARKVIVDPAKNANQLNTNPEEIKKTEERKSIGRSQAYYNVPASAFPAGTLGSAFGTMEPQDKGQPKAGLPMTSFWSQNTSSEYGKTRFRFHLDRPPSNIGDILNIPTCRPHEFLLLNNDRADYCAGWVHPSTHLFRFMELIQAWDTRILLDGTNNGLPVQIGSGGGRIPGKINLNTATYATFKALCDAQLTNRFTDQQIDIIWKYIVANRPFWGFGTWETSGDDALGTGKRGMNLSFLRKHPGYSDQPIPLPNSNSLPGNDLTDPYNLLLDPQNTSNNNNTIPQIQNIAPNLWLGFPPRDSNGNPPLSPFVRHELFSKISGNTTTRSNCFAAWVTVGFFEVIGEQGNPTSFGPRYILGQEMQPRIRRRMLALIDRTMLESWRIQLAPGKLKIAKDGMNPETGLLPNPIPIPLSTLDYLDGNGLSNLGSGFVFQQLTGKKYPVVKDAVLTIEPGTPYEETVEVIDLNPDPNIIELGIYLQRPHGENGTIHVCSRGNPGPIPKDRMDLDLFKGTGLIPYIAILE